MTQIKKKKMKLDYKTINCGGSAYGYSSKRDTMLKFLSCLHEV